MYPLVKPALCRLWRDGDTLQLGLDPQRAVVLAGVGPSITTLLALIDGSRTEDGVLRAARDAGLDPAVAASVLDLLAAAGALDDAAAAPGPLAALSRTERDRLGPDLASLSLLDPRPGAAAKLAGRRRSRSVHVLGGGRVAVPAATLLAAAGIGRVLVRADGAVDATELAPGGWVVSDVGRPAAAASRDALTRVCAEPTDPRPATDRPDPPDLVLLVGPAEDPAVRAELQRAGVPHLTATIRELTGTVGPLVVPGQTPCLRCLDLARADRDPAWPLLCAQLAGRTPQPAPCDTVLAAMVAAVTAGQALAFLDGHRPETVGGTLEVRLPSWRLRRRTVGLHPSCGCSWPEPAD